MPGEIFILQRATVKTHKVLCFTKNRCELIHNATVCADIVMLGSLTYFCKSKLVYFISAKEIVQRKSECAFKSSGRRHSCTKRHITCKGSVESFYWNSEFHHLTANTVNEAEMSSRRTLFVVKTEFYVIFQVNGISANLTGFVRFDFCDNSLLNGSRKYETVVVICVFADKINTSR